MADEEDNQEVDTTDQGQDLETGEVEQEMEEEEKPAKRKKKTKRSKEEDDTNGVLSKLAKVEKELKPLTQNRKASREEALNELVARNQNEQTKDGFRFKVTHKRKSVPFNAKFVKAAISRYNKKFPKESIDHEGFMEFANSYHEHLRSKAPSVPRLSVKAITDAEA